MSPLLFRITVLITSLAMLPLLFFYSLLPILRGEQPIINGAVFLLVPLFVYYILFLMAYRNSRNAFRYISASLGMEYDDSKIALKGKYRDNVVRVHLEKKGVKNSFIVQIDGHRFHVPCGKYATPGSIVNAMEIGILKVETQR